MSWNGGPVPGTHALDADLLTQSTPWLASRQPRRPYVADGANAGHSRAAPFVHGDMALFDLDPKLLEPEPFDIAGDAYGEDDAARLHRLGWPPDFK